MSGRPILVVDDEPALRGLLVAYLGQLGYEVVEAGSVEDARVVIGHNPDRFNLYFIDLTLPGMAGDELAARILRAQPQAGIVLSSGYPYDPSTLGGAGSRVVFLQKPFLAKQLADELRKLTAAE
jgi:CheY-like chemotaxis protein